MSSHNTSEQSSGSVAPSNPTQTEPVVTNSAGGASHVTTSGSLVSSDDPSTRPDASVTEKLKGDVQGAVKGTVGSLQASAGTALRNKDMEAKGLEKMQEEDQRLGAKRGVMPVGSDRRNEETDTNTSNISK